MIPHSGKLTFRVDPILINLLSLCISGHFTNTEILFKHKGSNRIIRSRQRSEIRIRKVMKGMKVEAAIIESVITELEEAEIESRPSQNLKYNKLSCYKRQTHSRVQPIREWRRV